ncbi:carboxylesterase family protein [Salana multivorans]
MPGALATTVHGVVRGTERSGSTAFYGLPYAAPPVGELMFSAPSPPDRWEGVRDASRPGPTAQRRGFDAGTIPEPSLPGDDYLTVNVFTPTTAEPGSDLPVLVYLHGGAYIAGSPVSPWYDGSAFNRDAIVVVTVGYRLGLLGFGSLRGATENRALLDWLAALEWVRDNIHAFGGDPDRVTLAGQSAGGGAVLTLLGTPGISGLVARAIAASPVLSQATTEEARRTADQAAALTGAAANVESLLALPSWTLHDLPWRMPNVFGSAAGRATAMTDPVALVGEILDSIEFCPTTDGNLVVRPIALGARECPIPLLIGATAHELTSTVPALLEPCDLAGLERLGLTADEAEGYVSARDPERRLGPAAHRPHVPGRRRRRSRRPRRDLGLRLPRTARRRSRSRASLPLLRHPVRLGPARGTGCETCHRMWLAAPGRRGPRGLGGLHPGRRSGMVRGRPGVEHSHLRPPGGQHDRRGLRRRAPPRRRGRSRTPSHAVKGPDRLH